MPDIQFTESLSLHDQFRLVQIAHEGKGEVQEFALKLLRQCWAPPIQVSIDWSQKANQSYWRGS